MGERVYGDRRADDESAAQMNESFKRVAPFAARCAVFVKSRAFGGLLVAPRWARGKGLQEHDLVGGDVKAKAHFEKRHNEVRDPLMDLRHQRYFDLSSQLSDLNDSQFRTWISDGESNDSSTGWGTNQTLDLAEAKVFVKRVPVTKLEYDFLFSTANHYRLPPFCCYGLGSPGFNVFRELVTHLKTTHWVLQGEAACFPLLYHYRVLPFSGPYAQVDPQEHRSLIESWAGNESVGRYALERAGAPYQLVLCLEHIPHVLESWLRDNPHRVRQVVTDAREAIAFLSHRGIIHFDAHFGNILTDGQQVYLTDFGLALDKGFALDEGEQRFFEQHTNYDTSELLRNLGRLIQGPYGSLSESAQQQLREKYGIPEGAAIHEIEPVLLDNIESLHADRLLNLEPDYVELVVRHRSAMALAHTFFATMWNNNAKDTAFPHSQLQRLLEVAPLL